MRIYFVRHGQAEWQARQEGSLDSPLTALGHEQSQRLARWLADRPQVDEFTRVEIDKLRTSPLLRARQTTAYLTDALGLPAEERPALGEAEFRVADVLPSRESPLVAVDRFQPSEAYSAFRAQAESALHDLVREAESGKAVLAVTHGGLLKTLLRVALGSDDVCFRIYNTGVTLLEWDEGRWHVVYLNLLEHLPAGARTR